MNAIDGHVTKVLGKPEHKVYGDRDTWQVEVEYWDDAPGRHVTKLMFYTEQEAYAVEPGYVFQH